MGIRTKKEPNFKCMYHTSTIFDLLEICIRSNKYYNFHLPITPIPTDKVNEKIMHPMALHEVGIQISLTTN